MGKFCLKKKEGAKKSTSDASDGDEDEWDDEDEDEDWDDELLFMMNVKSKGV